MGNCQALPCTESDADKKKTGKDGVQEVVEEVETLEAQASAKSGKLVSVSVNASSRSPSGLLPGASRASSAKSMKSKSGAMSTAASTKKSASGMFSALTSSAELPASESMKSANGEIVGEDGDPVNVALDAIGSSVDVTLTAAYENASQSPSSKELDPSLANGSASTSFKSVSFKSEGGDEGDDEEMIDDAPSSMLVATYLYVFDSVFNILLSILSSLAAIMHMLTSSGFGGMTMSTDGSSFLKWPDVMPITRIATQKFSEYIGGGAEEQVVVTEGEDDAE